MSNTIYIERDIERIPYDLPKAQALGLEQLAQLKNTKVSKVVRELLHKAFKDNRIPMPERDLELLEMIRNPRRVPLSNGPA